MVSLPGVSSPPQPVYLDPRIAARLKRLLNPSLFSLVLVSFATFVSLVALAMIATVFHNLARGLSTVDIERDRRWRVMQGQRTRGESRQVADGKKDWDPRLRLWVPDGEGKGGGATVVVEPGDRIFDLGFRRNWEAVMGHSMLDILGG